MAMAQDFRSGCPIATTLDLVGDRWTLVLIRDMIMGKSRYSEFLASPERITTNILASRLQAMRVAGLVEREPYQERPRRFAYRLTRKGRDLHLVLTAITDWAVRHHPECWTPPEAFFAYKP